MKKVLALVIFSASLSPLCSKFAQSSSSDINKSDKGLKAQETASAHPGQGARDLTATDGPRDGTGAAPESKGKILYDSGAALIEAGKFDEAIEKLKQAVKLDPADAAAQYSLGMAYSKVNRYSDAVESFKRAARLKPEWADAHFRLGWMYYVLDKKNQARDEYKKLLDLNPRLASTLLRMIDDAPKKNLSASGVGASNDQPSFSNQEDGKKEAQGPEERTKREQTDLSGSDRRINPAAKENQNQARRNTGAAANGDASGSATPSIIKTGNSINPPTISADPGLVNTYRVGVGDVLDIRILNSGTKASTLYTVMESGVIEFPLVGGSLAVAGLTPEEIQTRLAAELKRRAVQENGPLSVGVRQYTSHTVVLTGLVGIPGTKMLRREAVPLYVLLAEGQLRLEAARARIMRPDGTGLTVDLGDQSGLNVLIHAGDIINVGTRPQEFYYIGGRVNYPGQKNHQTGITLLQAILAAGGLVRSSENAVEISREGTDGRLATTKYSLRDIKAGKIPDPRLQPGDRIEVVR